MIKEVFRQTALEQMTSPDRQDEILTVTTPGDWIGLAAIALLVGGVFGGCRIERHLCEAEDDTEHVVEIVRDPAGQPANGLDLPRLRQLRLQNLALGLRLLALGDIAARHDDGADARVAEQVPRARVDPAPATVLVADAELGLQEPVR